MAGSRGRVLVGMSGGVDSSVAAALLRDQGWDVTGLFVCLGTAAEADGGSGCCSPQDAADARRVAGLLGIDLFVLQAAGDFNRVIDRFVAEYAAGRTPNPCVGCNRDIKFSRLVAQARLLGFDAIATGHYARVVERGGAPAIARARAREKDQSYVLFELPLEARAKLLLPLGELPGKGAVRELAKRLGLPVHDKPDSQEICFVGEGGYGALLAERAPAALTPGPIVDEAGQEVGRHQGYALYTIGQRRGLGGGGGEPRYVTGVEPATATVRVGPRSATLRGGLRAGRASWQGGLPGDGRVALQLRSSPVAAPATVSLDGDGFTARFDAPVAAVAPGQAAVLYDGEVVVGGGWIEAALPVASAPGPAPLSRRAATR
jgi:tRNA-specific 2-thiouridylase